MGNECALPEFAGGLERALPPARDRHFANQYQHQLDRQTGLQDWQPHAAVRVKYFF